MNSKKIFALKGRGETGKTTTLKLLIKRLTSINGSTCTYKNKDIENDVTAIIIINNIKVGISTGGDIAKIIHENVGYLINKGCSIIVSATRTKGGTIEEINELAGKEFLVEWFNKSRTDIENEQDKLNQSDAKIIFNKIEKIVNS